MTSLHAKLKRGAELLAALLFAAMFGAFVIQVVSRYVFDDPVSWSLEICSITYVWIVWKRGFAIFTSASILVIFTICLPTTIGYVMFSSRNHSLILHIPMDIIYSCFAIFMIGAIVGSAIRLKRLLGKSWQSDL